MALFEHKNLCPIQTRFCPVHLVGTHQGKPSVFVPRSAPLPLSESGLPRYSPANTLKAKFPRRTVFCCPLIDATFNTRKSSSRSIPSHVPPPNVFTGKHVFALVKQLAAGSQSFPAYVLIPISGYY